MRTTKELLEVLLENVDGLLSGLCGLILTIQHHEIISREEYHLLNDYIVEHPPKNFHYLRYRVFGCRPSYFYWRTGEVNPRVKWLKRHIKKNS